MIFLVIMFKVAVSLSVARSRQKKFYFVNWLPAVPIFNINIFIKIYFADYEFDPK